jgi:hypothetical protein
MTFAAGSANQGIYPYPYDNHVIARPGLFGGAGAFGVPVPGMPLPPPPGMPLPGGGVAGQAPAGAINPFAPFQVPAGIPHAPLEEGQPRQ